MQDQYEKNLKEEEDHAKKYLKKQKTLAIVKKRANEEYPNLMKESNELMDLPIVHGAEPGPN